MVTPHREKTAPVPRAQSRHAHAQSPSRSHLRRGIFNHQNLSPGRLTQQQRDPISRRNAPTEHKNPATEHKERVPDPTGTKSEHDLPAGTRGTRYASRVSGETQPPPINRPHLNRTGRGRALDSRVWPGRKALLLSLCTGSSVSGEGGAFGGCGRFWLVFGAELRCFARLGRFGAPWQGRYLEVLEPLARAVSRNALYVLGLSAYYPRTSG